MNFLVKMLIHALAVLVAAWLMPGVQVDGYITAILVAVVLAGLNYLVRPVLIVLTIPVTVITLGLFLLVINALIILIASSIVDGFHVSGFLAAFFFSLILSLVTSIFERIDKKEGNQRSR
ncbi:MAG: phage holin family protein [Bacteroidota bacterium]